MRHVVALVVAAFVFAVAVFGPTASAHAGTTSENSIDHGGVTVGISVSGPGSAIAGEPGGAAARPLVRYLISWSVDPTTAQTGSLNGLCAAPGGTAPQPGFGFLYHLVGTDATGTIVDDRFVCVAFPNGDPTQRPPVPPIPTVPTFGEAWDRAQLPAPAITLDPESRGVTGLDTRISTSGPTTVVIAATVRGFTITGTATLDHYEISVDGEPPVRAGRGHYTFERKGTHTIAVSAIWHGTAVLAGPGLPAPLLESDLGTAAITATRTYPVTEIRSVLQP